MPRPVYLGDGISVSFDGANLWLTTPRPGGADHVLAVEPTVWRALLAWFDRCSRLRQAAARPADRHGKPA